MTTALNLVVVVGGAAGAVFIRFTRGRHVLRWASSQDKWLSIVNIVNQEIEPGLLPGTLWHGHEVSWHISLCHDMYMTICHYAATLQWSLCHDISSLSMFNDRDKRQPTVNDCQQETGSRIRITSGTWQKLTNYDLRDDKNNITQCCYSITFSGI